MKHNWRERVALLAAALWWGSLTTIGFLVVPLLFAKLPTHAEAGRMAAQLFSAQTWVSLGAGLLLLMFQAKKQQEIHTGYSSSALFLIATGMLLALLQEFAIAPRIVAAGAGVGNLQLWHSLGSSMYLLQWLCALVLLWSLAGTRSAP